MVIAIELQHLIQSQPGLHERLVINWIWFYGRTNAVLRVRNLLNLLPTNSSAIYNSSAGSLSPPSRKQINNEAIS